MAIPLAIGGAVLSAIVLFVRMVPEWKRMSAIEKEIAAPADEPVA
jgi:hypothetical protein